MSNPEKQAREGSLRTRQCARQRVELPFQVGGLDSLGHFFEDRIVTRDFSECGGSFVTDHTIQVGSTLKLADSTGFLSLFKVRMKTSPTPVQMALSATLNAGKPVSPPPLCCT